MLAKSLIGIPDVAVVMRFMACSFQVGAGRLGLVWMIVGENDS